MQNLSAPAQENEATATVLLVKLGHAFDAVALNRAAFLKQPADPENIHQLRVAMRAYKSLLTLTKPFLPRRVYQSIQSLQRSQAQKTARLREIDVLIALIETLPKEILPLPGTVKGGKHPDDARSILLEAFKMRRLEHQARCLAYVQAADFEEGIHAAQTLLLEHLDRQSFDQTSVTDLIYPRLEKWYSSMLLRMEDYHEFNFAYVHRTRIMAKKTRYISELFEPYLNPLHLRWLKNAKALQTELGEICDCINNQVLILDILFPPEEAAAERTAAGLKNQSKLRRAANLLILAEKAAELGHREALEQRSWLTSIRKEGEVENHAD